MRRVVLLDMDGVITKSKRLSFPIRDRVCSYVSSRLKVPYHKAERINHHLYSNFGHTLLGLQKIYDPTLTLQDFCSYVYDPSFLKQLDPNPEEIQTFQQFVEKAKEKGIPVYIFTNANTQWVKHVLQSSHYPTIACDHPIYAHSMSPEPNLKPNPSTYIRVMQYLKAQQYIFVDDSIPNLLPMLHHKDWKVIWMNNDPYTKENIQSHNLHTINELNQFFISL